MIFLTVGSQLPFDRMVRLVDDWARLHSNVKVVAQIGKSGYRSHTLECHENFAPKEFNERVQKASLVLAHAGMGSILTALKFGKPILIFPRRGHLNETRNDHQVATARALIGRPGVTVALDDSELATRLNEVMNVSGEIDKIGPYASESLLRGLREFILSGR